MKKIPTIYQRDPDTNHRHVKNEPHPDCQWVFDGEGAPSYKHDGTAVKITRDGLATKMWKRREVKKGKPEPDGFRQEGDTDPNTGKRVGWVPCDRNDPNDRWHFEALDADETPPPATYELVGPKVQGNPHGHSEHYLIPHGSGYIGPVPTEFGQVGAFLWERKSMEPGFEGVVWHHPDGRMAKIKVRDFPKDTPV